MANKAINIREIEKSAVKMIGDEWALVNSSANGSSNTMTVSWGGIGELWEKDVVFIFIRPQRYTYGLLENSDSFSMSFFGGEKKKELGLCGKISGRDGDKFAAAGLTPIELDGVVCVKEAKYNVICKKIACQDLNPNGFIDKSIEGIYPTGDYHRMYVGEIVKVYETE